MPGPPEFTEDDLISTTIFGAASSATASDELRSWDSGATFGMDQIGEHPEIEFKGQPVKISTGNSVVESNTWARHQTPWGEVNHICLKSTARTVSAGQCNASFGVETSWLSPSTLPSSTLGSCILH